MEYFRHNPKKHDLCQVECSGKGDLAHDPMSGKGQPNQDFPTIPWKPVLGVGDGTDFT